MADTTVHAGPALKRSLGLTMLVLYGLGVTIGAGIYVLIGAAAARAGPHAPIAFVIAAAIMALSAASFAELATRMPVSAGEAVYVEHGFGSQRLGLFVGLLVVAAALISSAAIAQGAAGYLGVFINAPPAVAAGRGDRRHGARRGVGHIGGGLARGDHDGDRDRRIVAGGGRRLVARSIDRRACA